MSGFAPGVTMPDRLGGFEIAPSPADLGFDPAGIDRLRAYMAGMVEAGRIAGDTPAAISLLLVHLKRSRTRGRAA